MQKLITQFDGEPLRQQTKFLEKIIVKQLQHCIYLQMTMNTTT